MASPFAVLGLAGRPDLTDDEVRAAWRRVAAATHPDRADGGDPAAFAAAAAAYTTLRTATGRGEALADLAGPGGRVPRQPVSSKVGTLGWRIRNGRPVRLVARLTAAAGVGAAAVTSVGWRPASAAVLTGLATWLLVTGRRDLAARSHVQAPEHNSL